MATPQGGRLMKRERLLCAVIGLAVIVSLLSCPATNVPAQIFNCTVRRDVNIPYPYEFFKTRILANAAFEIKFTVRDNENNKVYVRLIPGTHDPVVTVDEKTLTYYLGSGLYGTTKSDYETIGSSEDDVLVPGISDMFFQATAVEDEWTYEYDTNYARITDITISSDQARIKYIEFWDNEFRDANMHEDSQDFEDFDDFEDTEWENLTPNVGVPAIIDDDEVLYLTLTIPPQYSTPYYYNPYYSYYPSSARVYYGNMSSFYPGSSLSSFRGNYPFFPYSYSSSYPSYPYSYQSFYPSSYQSGFMSGYLAGTSGRFPYSYSTALFGGYYRPFLGLPSSRTVYGMGIPPFGSFYI